MIYRVIPSYQRGKFEVQYARTDEEEWTTLATKDDKDEAIGMVEDIVNKSNHYASVEPIMVMADHEEWEQ